MKPTFLSILITVALIAPAAAWKNPRKSSSLDTPIFGTHDYIAFQGYILAGRPTWVKNNLNAFLIGTEAPDNGFKLPDAEGGYNDASHCHCILFGSTGQVTNDRLEIRTREEFDKAKAAFTSGKKKLAAFYAGAIGHYIGDLGQFHHIMGGDSHWGSEDQKHHAAYEVAVEATIRFQDRSSTLLDAFIKPFTVSGQTPETIARSAARYTENGVAGHTTGWMYSRWKKLRQTGKSAVENWDAAFTDQTGQNVNVAANAIAKLLRLIGS